MLDRRSLLTGPPALMLASAASAAPPASLRWDNRYLFPRVQVNGRPLDALLDFDARATLLDRRHAAMLGLSAPAGETMIEAAGRHVGLVRASIVDLADYANVALHGRIGMVLGRDLFAAGPWLLDLTAPSLAPVDRATAQRGVRLSLTDRFGYDTVPVAFNGIAGHAALAFRDLDPLRVSAIFAARIGLARPRGSAAVRRLASAAAGVTVDRLEVAGLTIPDLNATLEAGDHIPDAWLGPAILRRFRIGIDLSAGALWFDRAA